MNIHLDFSFGIKKIILLIFVFLIPFYDVPTTVKGGLPIAFFYSLALFPFVSLLFYKALKINTNSLFLFYLFLFYLLIITLFNINNVGGKGINHVVFYGITFYLYYLFFYAICLYLGHDIVRKVLRFSVFIIIIIGLYEMSLFYTKGFNAYASFLNHGEHVGIYAGFFPRMRSTFNEPSHLALFLAGVAPIVLPRSHTIFKFFFFLGLICTFSSSIAVAIVGASLICFVRYFLFPFFIKGKINYKIIFFALSGIILFLYLAPSGIWNKVTNMESADTVRHTVLVETLNHLTSNVLYLFFGSGASSYYLIGDGTGVFNLYLQLLLEAGVVGLFLFLIFILYSSRIFKINAISFFWLLTILIQYIGMNHYYIPGLWLLLAWSNFKNEGNESLTSNK